MAYNSVAAVGFIGIIAIFALVAMAAPNSVVQDDPPRPLEAAYHDLPDGLVNQLRAQVPPRPYAFLDESCFTYKRGWFRRDVPYCVCYTEKACAALMTGGKCSAKLGAVAPGVGVCRADPDPRERVVVVG